MQFLFLRNVIRVIYFLHSPQTPIFSTNVSPLTSRFPAIEVLLPCSSSQETITKQKRFSEGRFPSLHFVGRVSKATQPFHPSPQPERLRSCPILNLRHREFLSCVGGWLRNHNSPGRELPGITMPGPQLTLWLGIHKPVLPKLAHELTHQ